MDDQKNLLIAVAIAISILVAYQFFVTGPAMRREAALREAEATEEMVVAAETATPTLRSPEEVRQETQRVAIDNPHVRGSLSLTGARIDDLFLKDHFVSVEAKEAQDPSGEVELLRPRGAEGAFYALIGWATVADGPEGLPGLDTQWRLVEGDNLTPETPVTLEYETAGLSFRRVISVDDYYMFTVTDTVENASDAPVVLSSYGQVRRHGLAPDYQPFYIIHEGGAGVAGGQLHLRKYKKLATGETREHVGVGGWAGLSDKYWLAAAIPDPQAEIDLRMRALRTVEGSEFRTATFESTYQVAPATLAPGGVLTSSARVFAGAKEYDVLLNYQEDLNIDRFIWAIDWGNFWFLTRPYFWGLEHIDSAVGNFGVAILIIVVIIKLLFFPIANKSYASLAKMKTVQPKLKALQDKYKDDRERLQKEMMALYRKEGVNPVAGCLPVLLQIPVFFALYKTIFVTIEMRHEPFVGWIRDLSAPDPTMIGNLFGLIPWDPTIVPIIGPAVLTLGVWPIIMGITMWAVQSLNPPPPDPTQARIIGLMPIFFTFILGSFAVGLVIYWAWNNLLSMGQQYVIMRRNGVETQVDKLIARLRGRPPETED